MNSDGLDMSGTEDKAKSPEDMASDAEGVWSPDIEQSFQEALAIYPPCGRRKIILSDEGKMYGRNELIARYIKLRTGKTRTRKQVSSHIQVLARKKAREIQSKLKDQAARDKALQTMASMSSAQIVSASVLHNKNAPPSNNYNDHYSSSHTAHSLPALPSTPYWSGQGSQAGSTPTSYGGLPTTHTRQLFGGSPGPSSSALVPSNSVSSSSDEMRSPYAAGSQLTMSGSSNWSSRNMPLRLIDFQAFVEQTGMKADSYHKHLFVHLGPNVNFQDSILEAVDIRQIYDKFPDKKGGLRELYEKGPQSVFFLVKFWADLNTNVKDESGSFYGVSSTYESSENMTITCSTKVCSFGKQVVEKVETEYAHFENGRFVYRIIRSPMCEYMINFIHKLKQLPEKYMMNSVLENFTILQTVTNRDTQDTLLCLSYVFEVSTSEHGAQHHLYRLVKD
ncbi:transcriptional enhancer factor TEF-1-like isoform X3 [Xenia sp. Carnegie-2017]|uniref:transcriptional enhancer factor TEF-1-like isoform X3 n=1 Tax=Xenia sp. Carnegie-2017 TaxID=2897299 RepID=UPI001F03D0DE|nr:transcriptional enhancer factor TEF-1-like isoform X3 [Xenia sp. Carnegie-2017]